MNPEFLMTNKRIGLRAIAVLGLTATIGIAAPRGGAVAAPHFAPAMTHAAPAYGTNWHHHRGRGAIFYDSFGYPFYPWWGWDYPYAYYPYGPYYNGTPGYAGSSVVVQVQDGLARAGYYHGAIDGDIGPRTHSAIRRYERSHGLYVDGEISDELLTTMGLRD